MEITVDISVDMEGVLAQNESIQSFYDVMSESMPKSELAIKQTLEDYIRGDGYAALYSIALSLLH